MPLVLSAERLGNRFMPLVLSAERLGKRFMPLVLSAEPVFTPPGGPFFPETPVQRPNDDANI